MSSIAFVPIFVLYPLSPGPVAYFLNTALGGALIYLVAGPEIIQIALAIIYAPLTFCIDHCPEFVQSGFQAYVDWWRALAGA